LRGEDFEWSQKQRLSDVWDSLRFDEGKRPLLQTIGSVRLVVVEYYGTVFLEVLAANVPAVLFWDSHLWELRDESQPYFEGLRKAGILWDSPEGAAQKVSEVYGEPRVWWESEAVQEVRQVFVDRYALGREDWLACWVKTLKEEIALSHVQ
jgi:putative transferase (TIGR04331 family)